ncbi:MAG: sugar transporter [gamma proteobacterium endosymbiont of Lamellibrachia anaximandri]|nr:sugar transporter [gamma proteobacterium endosymbiont of Lamellibrachia anaximandri]
MAKSMFIKLDRSASLLTLVIIPFALLVLYYSLVASDRYTSEAIFTIKENGNSSNSLDIGLLGIGNPSGLEDERIMKEYLISGDMLAFLDKELGHRAHYQKSSADWFSALPVDATREEYLEYYRDHIDVYFDELSGLLFVEVQAFERDYAKQLLETVLQHAEGVVNEISHRLAMAQYEFVEQQLVKTQESLKISKQRLLEFQNRYQIFSPEQQGQSLTAIMDIMEGELSQEKAKLKQLLGFQKSNSPQVIASKERIRALTEQIIDEKRRLIGEGDEELNDLMVKFTNLQLDLEFTKDAYASALAALAQSRAEASKKMKHLVVISKPSLADEAKYPERVYILVTALIVLLMLFGIVRMTITTIREHQD